MATPPQPKPVKSSVKLLASRFGQTVKAKKVKTKKKNQLDQSDPEFANAKLKHVDLDENEKNTYALNLTSEQMFDVTLRKSPLANKAQTRDASPMPPQFSLQYNLSNPSSANTSPYQEAAPRSNYFDFPGVDLQISKDCHAVSTATTVTTMTSPRVKLKPVTPGKNGNFANKAREEVDLEAVRANLRKVKSAETEPDSNNENDNENENENENLNPNAIPVLDKAESNENDNHYLDIEDNPTPKSVSPLPTSPDIGSGVNSYLMNPQQRAQSAESNITSITVSSSVSHAPPNHASSASSTSTPNHAETHERRDSRTWSGASNEDTEIDDISSSSGSNSIQNQGNNNNNTVILINPAKTTPATAIEEKPIAATIQRKSVPEPLSDDEEEEEDEEEQDVNVDENEAPNQQQPRVKDVDEQPSKPEQPATAQQNEQTTSPQPVVRKQSSTDINIGIDWTMDAEEKEEPSSSSGSISNNEEDLLGGADMDIYSGSGSSSSSETDSDERPPVKRPSFTNKISVSLSTHSKFDEFDIDFNYKDGQIGKITTPTYNKKKEIEEKNKKHPRAQTATGDQVFFTPTGKQIGLHNLADLGVGKITTPKFAKKTPTRKPDTDVINIEDLLIKDEKYKFLDAVDPSTLGLREDDESDYYSDGTYSGSYTGSGSRSRSGSYSGSYTGDEEAMPEEEPPEKTPDLPPKQADNHLGLHIERPRGSIMADRKSVV